MDAQTLNRKSTILEHALAASAGVYYNINLTQDRIPGVIEETIAGKSYNVNAVLGLPENARFSEVAALASGTLEETERAAYDAFLSVPGLLTHYHEGETHVHHRFWTKTVLGEPMLAEQHIIMYDDAESGDVLAVAYLLDLTREYNEEKYKAELESEMAALQNIHEALVSGAWKFQYNERGEQISCRWSDTMRSMLGFESTADFPDVIESWSDRLHPEDKAFVMNEFMSTVADYSGRKTYDVEYRLRNKAGEYHWFRAAGRLSRRADGSPIAFDGVFISTDAKKEQERLRIAYQVAESANEAKTTFLLNMSHDIRTPMNAILGYSRLMRKKLTDPELLRDQEMIEQSGNLLLSIINNVLDMARIESGKMELDENYDQAGDIVGGVCGVFEAEARKKNIDLRYSVDVQHANIMCDSTKVQEIFTNLISNAVKYTPPGGRVTVTTRELPCEQPGHVCIETAVEDTGIGMSAEFLPHLFESFSRERNTTAGKVAGSGLGMAIVKSLVDLMGGTIEVSSELGRGSRFAVAMTHKLADTEYYEKKKHIDGTEDADFSGKHVLLAEDNALNAEIAMIILEEMGFTVELAQDGVICVDKLEKAPAGTYDLILMDIQMPNMDGYKATQIIRRLPDARKANIPIVAMTANAFAEDRKKALDMGMNAHIAKPIDSEQIQRTLEPILK